MSAKQDFYAPGCQAMLAAAKGVLVVLFGCDLDAAATELLRVAGVHELDVLVLAEALVTVASTRARPQGGGVAGTDVVADEWGEELCFCRSPVRPRIRL